MSDFVAEGGNEFFIKFFLFFYDNSLLRFSTMPMVGFSHLYFSRNHSFHPDFQPISVSLSKGVSQNC